MGEKSIEGEMEAKGQRRKRKRKEVLKLKAFVLPLQNLTSGKTPRGHQVEHPSPECQ